MEDKNTTVKDFMVTDYTSNKLDKKNELNETMTISQTSQDEYTKKINSLGGNNNND